MIEEHTHCIARLIQIVNRKLVPFFIDGPVKVPGKLRWVTTSIARFDPELNWPPDLRLQVRINLDLTAHDGAKLDLQYRSSFSFSSSPSSIFPLMKLTDALFAVFRHESTRSQLETSFQTPSLRAWLGDVISERTTVLTDGLWNPRVGTFPTSFLATSSNSAIPMLLVYSSDIHSHSVL